MAKTDPKILLWDIESNSLNACFGTILCIGYKWLGQKKVHCPTLFDYERRYWSDDSGLVRDFVEGPFEEADYTVAHYGKRFDMKMVNTKCLEYGLFPPPKKYMCDTWEVAKGNFKFHNNRLQSISEFLQTLDEKTPIAMKQWKEAMVDEGSMKYVVKHCVADVNVLEQVFNHVRPWVYDEPHRGLFVADSTGCVSCGSSNLHRRGFHTAQTLRYQRYRCMDCGKWQRAKAAEKVARGTQTTRGY